MPIVSDEKGSVHIEYDMPKEIRDLIDRDFLIEFRNQLYRIFDYWALDSFDEEGISMNTSTAGWAAALGKACINTHKEAIYAYWKKLDWYDSDIFDGELANILLEEKIVLGSFGKYIKEYLGINSEIRDCCDCFGYYEDSEVIELPKKEAEDEYSSYRCKTCEAIKSGKILKKDAKHNDLNKRLKPFLFDIISKDLSIDKEILVKCSKCELIYSNDLGVINDSGIFTCHYCNDAFKTGEEKTHATNYYRDIWKEIDSVDWNVFEISIGVSENGKKDD